MMAKEKAKEMAKETAEETAEERVGPMGRLRRFVKNKTGVSAVEYTLIIVAVIAIIGVGAGILSGAFKDLFEDLSTEMQTGVASVKAKATP